MTDASGNYRFSGLQESGFTVNASAGGYATQSTGVTLTSDQMVSFQLVHLPPPTPPPAGTTIIGFSGLSVNGASIGSYSESGFTVVATTGTWTAATTRIVNAIVAVHPVQRAGRVDIGWRGARVHRGPDPIRLQGR